VFGGKLYLTATKNIFLLCTIFTLGNGCRTARGSFNLKPYLTISDLL